MKKEKCRHQLFDYEADYVICTACLFLPLLSSCHIGLWVAVIGILGPKSCPSFSVIPITILSRLISAPSIFLI